MLELLLIPLIILPAVGLLAFVLSPKKVKPIPKKEVLVDSLSMDILEATVEVATEKRISPEEYAFLYNTVEVEETKHGQD